MKKLMTMIAYHAAAGRRAAIAMTCAVATAFGLFAADTPDPSTYYSTSFEAGDAGCSDGTTFNWEAAGWTTDCTDEFKLADHADELLPYADGRVRRDEFFSAKDTNNKYLMLATGTNEIKHEIGGADRVFFDQLVKFTGFEEAPVVADGTKIAVWLSATETDESTVGATNLYVTAGTGTTATNLQIAADVAVDTWYRLTIKSLGNVIDESAGQQVGFLVYINGELATIVEGQRDYHANSAKLLAPADGFYGKGQLFTAIDTTSAALTSVGYQGIGGVDDIIFSKDAPDFAASVNVTVAEITGAEIEVKDADGNPIALTSGYYALPRGAFSVTYTAKENFILPGAPIVKNYNTEEKTEVDDRDTVTPAAVVASILYDSLVATTNFAALADALTFINDWQTEHPEDSMQMVTIKEACDYQQAGAMYAFPKDAQIMVSASAWEVSADGVVTNTFGAMPEKVMNVSVATEFGSSTLALAGNIYGGSDRDEPIETSVVAEDVELVGNLTIGDYFNVQGEGGASLFINGALTVGEYKIALKNNGKVTSTTRLTIADVFAAPPDGYEVKETVVEDEETLYVYSLKDSRKFSGGEGTEADPYILATVYDFNDLKADVDGGEAYADTFFKLGDDVALTEWTGIGNGSQQTGTDLPFSGVFNGNGKTLTVSYACALKYMGLFNCLSGGAVVSNLTIQASVGNVIGGATSYGIGAVAGEAAGDVTIEKVTVNGELGNSDVPLTHNSAGFVVYIKNLDTGTVLFKDCVNNASVYSTYNNAGGFIANASNKPGYSVVFENCDNTASITGTGNATSTTVSGIGGIIGYRGESGTSSFADCSNSGVITAGGEYVCVGSIVGRANGNSVVTGLSGNSAQADIPAVGYETGVITGLNFATVDGTTATFVADDALALDGSYKVMAPQATATFEFTEAGTIAFDEELVAVKTWAITADEDAFTLTWDTAGTVKTYTCVAKSTDPREADPKTEDEVPGALANLGVSDLAKANIKTVAEFKAFEGYFAAKTTGVAWDNVTAGQKANAYLCYALNAAAIPTEEITDGDVTIDSFANGVIEIAIEGVEAGESVSAAMIAKVIDVIGNNALTEMTAGNVAASGQATANGKVQVTVAPAEAIEDKSKFFYRASVKK